MALFDPRKNSFSGGGGGGVSDHGLLLGLGDDDHTHYSLADGTRWTPVQTAEQVVSTNASGHLVVSGMGWNGSILTLPPGGSISMLGASSGNVVIEAPAVAGANTITLPAATGTVALLSNIPSVSDAAYGPAWNGDLGAASKNAIYDQMETRQQALVNVRAVELYNNGANGTAPTFLDIHTESGPTDWDARILRWNTSGGGQLEILNKVDPTLSYASNQAGLLVDYATGNIYYKQGASNYEIYHTENFTDNSANWDTAFGWGNHATAGYVDTSGTPANNQLAIFTDQDTIEGDPNVTYDGNVFAVNNEIRSPRLNIDFGMSAMPAAVGSQINVDFQNSSGLTGVRALRIQSFSRGTNTGDGMAPIGLNGIAQPSAPMSTIYGNIELNSIGRADDLNSYDVTSFHNKYIRADNYGALYTGTVTNLSTIRVANPPTTWTTAGATITNNYGIYIEDFNRGVNNYPIYIAGQTGNIAIRIAGNDEIHTNGDIRQVGSTSGSILVKAPAVAGSNTITWPAKTGTVALTSDIPSVIVDTSGSPAAGYLSVFSDPDTITGTSSLSWSSSILNAAGEIRGQKLNINSTNAALPATLQTVISPTFVGSTATDVVGVSVAPDLENRETAINKSGVVDISPTFRAATGFSAAQKMGVTLRPFLAAGSGGSATMLHYIGTRITVDKDASYTGTLNSVDTCNIEAPSGFSIGTGSFQVSLRVASPATGASNIAILTTGTAECQFGGHISLREKIDVRGTTSGTITLNLASATAGTHTITLPSKTGTVAIQDGTSVTGSRGGNAALASLLTALAASGLIVDNTTA